MKYGVIDIGSNSIRLMISDGVVTISKELIVTRLGEGLALTGRLSDAAIARAMLALRLLSDKAALRCDAVYVFATEAVRSAANGGVLIRRAKSELNIDIELIDGEEEAELGFLGVNNGGSVGIIDIGGASTELVIGSGGRIISSRSAKIGVMRLLDLAGEDREKAETVIAERFAVYDTAIEFDTLIGIGGTATTLAAVALELEEYDRAKVDGFVLTLDAVEGIIARLSAMSIKERKKVKGLMPERADVIVGGAYILSLAMRIYRKIAVKVSEGDNLEGFLVKKTKSSKS